MTVHTLRFYLHNWCWSTLLHTSLSYLSTYLSTYLLCKAINTKCVWHIQAVLEYIQEQLNGATTTRIGTTKCNLPPLIAQNTHLIIMIIMFKKWQMHGMPSCSLLPLGWWLKKNVSSVCSLPLALPPSLLTHFQSLSHSLFVCLCCTNSHRRRLKLMFVLLIFSMPLAFHPAPATLPALPPTALVNVAKSNGCGNCKNY